jgi:integrase/recombinase XerD
LDPLAVRRFDVELFLRWLQEARQLKPSTVSRLLSVVIGFYPHLPNQRRPRPFPGPTMRRPTVRPDP